MNTILLVLCNGLSCFIISTILFQFMNGKYKKSSRNRYVYIVIETTTVIFTFCINMLNHSILNLVVWGVLTGMIAGSGIVRSLNLLELVLLKQGQTGK